MNLTEKEYGALYKHSLKQAHRFVGYADTAYDIAQNAILAYLSSKTRIAKPLPWLSLVVKREAIKLKTLENKEKKLIQTSAVENKLKPESQESDSFNFTSISYQKIRYLLDEKDYTNYLLLKKYDFSPSRCSEHENIPFQTAKSNLHKIKKNLVAGYLFEEGWRHGLKILNFKQYYNISRGINKLIECVKEQRLTELRTYFRKVDNEMLEVVFEDVVSCLEWTVIFENNVYKLILVCTTINQKPKFIEVTFKFNKANFMFITEAVEKSPFLVTKSSIDTVAKFKEKGKITLSEEQIVAFLSDTQTKT